MTLQTMVACPHCQAENPAGAAFCESCGKAMPAGVRMSPRVLSADAMPATAAGAKLVGSELQKKTKSASNTLLIVGIIQLVVGGILYAILANAPAATRAQVNLSVMLLSTVGLSAVFFGLYAWSRRSPLPATITGLVIYCTLVAINVVVSLSNLAQSNRSAGGLGGLGIGWLDIVIIAVLVRGINAAIQGRRVAQSPVT